VCIQTRVTGSSVHPSKTAANYPPTQPNPTPHPHPHPNQVRQLEKRWALQLAAMSDVEGAVQMLRPLEAYDTPYLVG